MIPFSLIDEADEAAKRSQAILGQNYGAMPGADPNAPNVLPPGIMPPTAPETPMIRPGGVMGRFMGALTQGLSQMGKPRSEDEEDPYGGYKFVMGQLGNLLGGR